MFNSETMLQIVECSSHQLGNSMENADAAVQHGYDHTRTGNTTKKDNQTSPRGLYLPPLTD